MDYKELIVESGLKMLGSGMTIETWGNISYRDPKEGLVYMSPSAMSYDTITADDVVVCRPDGSIVKGDRKPTIEKELHLSIFRERPDVNAVVHTHPLYSMVYSCQGKDIPMLIDEAAQVLGCVCKTADYALPGSPELAKYCVKALGQKANACLLQSHGAVCVGQSMEAAFKVAKVLEVTAQIYYMIESTGGKPINICGEHIEMMQDFVKNHYGQDK